MKAIEVKIPLTPGVVAMAIVDDRDFAELNQFNWSLNPDGYATSTSEGRTIRMHRVVASINNNQEVTA
jgi:hypothetical protein